MTKPVSHPRPDADLTAEVRCVDFHLDDGGPGLDLELNCGEIVRRPIDDERPNSDAQPVSGVSHIKTVSGLKSS